jgi:hypothetical protein
MTIACFVLVGVGTLLILIGVYISVVDWQKKLDELPVDRKQARLAEELSGLAKVADAIKGFPLGQQLIVWGIVILIIGGLFGGVSGIIASKSC